MSSGKKSFIWAFYFLQGEEGEDRSHPNAFQIPANKSDAQVSFSEFLRHFPLANLPQLSFQNLLVHFHFRFRVNHTPSAKQKSSASTSSTQTYYWLDIVNLKQNLPLTNGRIICKVLNLSRANKCRPGLILKRKKIIPLRSSSANTNVAARMNNLNVNDPAAFQRSNSSPRTSSSRPAPYSDQQFRGKNNPVKKMLSPQGLNRGCQNYSTATNNAKSVARNSPRGSGVREHPPPRGKISSLPERIRPTNNNQGGSCTSEESFEDFVNSSSPRGKELPVAGSRGKTESVDLMGGEWDGDQSPSTNSRVQQFDPLSTSPTRKNAQSSGKLSRTFNNQNNFPKADGEFQENGQTIGPVTLAEMEKVGGSSSDGSCVYNSKFIDKSTKSVEVQKAMESRERKKKAEIEKARNDLRQRNAAAETMEQQKQLATKRLDGPLRHWAEDSGQKKNIRTLISTMHQVMGPNSKWKEVSMANLLLPIQVKKHYRRAMLVVHPDKNSGRTIEELVVAERVFDAISVAWDEFEKTEMQ